MTIQQRIFDVMEQKHISQSVLAKETGISQSTISDWKHKSKMPSSDKIIAIAECLDVPVSYLLGVDAQDEFASMKKLMELDYDIVKADNGTITISYKNEDVVKWLEKGSRVHSYIENMKTINPVKAADSSQDLSSKIYANENMAMHGYKAPAVPSQDIFSNPEVTAAYNSLSPTQKLEIQIEILKKAESNG